VIALAVDALQLFFTFKFIFDMSQTEKSTRLALP